MGLKFTKLTSSRVNALKPNQKLQEHGIEFQRLPNGDGKYLVNAMINGKREHRLVGRESEGVTRTEAEQFLEKLKSDARADRLNMPKGRKLPLGFREAAGKYLELLPKEGGKDIKAKTYRLNQHLIPFFKDKPLVHLVTFEVERYKKHRQDQGASIGTINRELAALSHLLNKAKEWRWIEQKPCIIKRFKETGGRITYLTVPQTRRLLEEAQIDADSIVYPFILIGLETAMRPMEIFSIQVKNIDLNKLTIYIPESKTGHRDQPITANLVKFLKDYLSKRQYDSPWLFPSKNSKTGHVVNIRKAFRRVVEKAGLDPDEVVRHTLRHTAITHLVQAGVDIPTVQRISGHKTPSMVFRYSHQNGLHIQAAMSKLEKRYKNKSKS